MILGVWLGTYLELVIVFKERQRKKEVPKVALRNHTIIRDWFVQRFFSLDRAARFDALHVGFVFLSPSLTCFLYFFGRILTITGVEHWAASG